MKPTPGSVARLRGRVALVTGVSRSAGIGASIVERLLADGACVFASGLESHDAEMPWGADAQGGPHLAATLDPSCTNLHWESLDLEPPRAAGQLVEACAERFGRIDVVVAAHARSSSLSLLEITPEELDHSWAVNARSLVLLARRFAEVRPIGIGGRLVLFTSGQHIAPMSSIAYAVSKGAVHQMTISLADALMARGITVNCINPGPTDTGWASQQELLRVASLFPTARWGTPGDVANLVSWLVSDDAAWMTGQVFDQEGGFRREAPS